MNRPFLPNALLLIMLLTLASCQSDIDLQSPGMDVDVDRSFGASDAGDKFALGPVGYSQEELAAIYESFESVETLDVSHEFALRLGGTFEFIPPGYPRAVAEVELYTCSISVPFGAVPADGPARATITLSIQAHEAARSFSDASNPQTTFTLHTDHPGGLHFVEPISVTICKHPVAESLNPAAKYRLLRVERTVVDGKFLYREHDAQVVEVDPDTEAFTVQMTAVPERKSSHLKDGDGDGSGYVWAEPPCVPNPLPCP